MPLIDKLDPKFVRLLRGQPEPESFDLEKAIPSAKDNLPPLTPDQLKGPELSPFEQSPLGQYLSQNSVPEDTRSGVEKAQDFVNSQKEAYGLGNGEEADPFANLPVKAKKSTLVAQAPTIPVKPIGKSSTPAKDTTNFAAGPEDTETEGIEDDPNDSILHPSESKFPQAKTASEYLALSKGTGIPGTPTSPEVPMAPTQEQQKPNLDVFNQQLEDAREQDRQRNMNMGLLKAAQMGGAALAGTKADTSYADTELADKNRETTRLKTNMDMIQENAKMLEDRQKQDPNSKTSKLYQEALLKLNPKMDVSGLSASQVEKAFPTVAAAINRQDLIQMHREDNEQKSLDRQAAMEVRKQAALDKVDEKDRNALVKAQKEMDEQRANSRTPLGREVLRYNGGIHAQSIIDKYRGRENEMPNLVKKDLAIAIATMVSPGLPHESTINALDLKTFNGDVADVISKVTGVPYGGRAGGYVKFMDGMIKNQMDVSKKIIKQQQAKQLAVYKNQFTNAKTYDILSSLYQDKDDLGTAPVGSQADINSTTVSKAPVSQPAQDTVTIKSKKTGTVKTLPADRAQKYLSDPNFERVQ